MAIVVEVVLKGVTPAQYDALRAEVGWLENAPTGGLSHVTWFEGDDNYNLDAWESEETLNAFVSDRLGPGLAKVGIGAQPEVTVRPAHEVFTPQSVKIT